MAATSPTDVDGLFKEIYADRMENLIPDASKMIKMIRFVEKSKEIGKSYNQPVIVQQFQGVTYAQPDAGAFDLAAAISMKTQNAVVGGYQIVLRAALAYDVASRASTGGKKAFVEATELAVQNMLETMSKRVDIGILHGQTGIAEIAVGGFDETTGGATTASFVVTVASWSAGTWAGMTGAKLMFYSDSSLVISGGTNLNANDTTDAVVVTAVDSDTRTISVSSSASAIEDINDNSASKALRVYFDTAVQGTGASFEHNEQAGLKRIITNTGTLFNINAAVYDLWKGNLVTVSGQLSFGKIQTTIARCVNRGLIDDVVVVVYPDAWSDLLDDLAALRMFDSSYSSARGENGSKEIVFYGQNGEIKIVPYNICQSGEAFLFPLKKALRIGAQDISFKTPGMSDDIFLHLTDKAGYELRAYTDQSVFLEQPAACAYITGFVNSAA